MTEPQPPVATFEPGEPDDNRLIAERRRKLAELRRAGNAYPNDFRKTVTAAELHRRFGDLDDQALAGSTERFAMAGRMMAKRVMGRIAFARIQDRSGSIRLVVQRDQLPDGIFEQFKNW